MSEETFIAPQPEQLSELLPAFDFQSFIAQGGMGAVYKAKQRSLDRDVAIKILPREFGENPEFRASFETEAKAMAKLNHPNLIGVYDFGAVDGMPYIVMEYVDGSSLYHSAWGKVIAREQAVSLVKAICEGLGHAHENGILHRDIKPANILLTPKAEPKIGDFGLAQSVEGEEDGLIMGTPGYTAPEVLLDHRTADQRADIYAIGVILHELITGQRPDPEYKESFQPSNDPQLDKIWRRATASDPAQRYASAYDMAADLGAWTARPAARLVTPAAPTTGRMPARTTSVLAPPRPPAMSGNPRPAVVPARRKPTPVAHGGGGSFARNLFIIALLIGGIAITWKSLRKEKDEIRTENQEIQRRNQEALEAQRKLLEEQKKATAAKDQEAPESVPRDETPERSLARLQKALLSGLRTQMPTGSETRGESSFIVINRPMTWQAAADYAEQHGGHLAVAGTSADLAWLTKLLPENSSVWLGAGRLNADGWVQVDGSAWPVEQSPVGVGDFATLDSLGIVRARSQNSELPFVVQWHMDGKNPGSLEAMLRRASETLGEQTPVFPPGTRFQGARRFCAITRPVQRAEAVEIVRQSGGVLAAPATREEQIWIEETFDKIEAPDGLWLGGEKDGLDWTWLSGDPWEATAWSERALPEVGGTAMIFVPGDGWVDADPNKYADGFIIEWSSDAGGAAVSDLGEAALEHSDVADLRSKAVDLVAKAVEKRDEELKANVSKLVWDLNVWLRGLNATERVRWEAHVTAMTEALEGLSKPRLPAADKLGRGGELVLAPDMRKSLAFYKAKEASIDAAHVKELRTIQAAYAKRLQAIQKEVGASGESTIAASIARMIQHSKNVEGWAKGLLGAAR